MICQVVPTLDVPAAEVVHLLEVVDPALRDRGLLGLEQLDRGRELRVVERVGVGDLELGLGLHQHDRGVGDVDRRVVDADLVAAGRVEHLGPGRRCRRDLVGPPHQQVRAASVRDAVGHAVDRVVGLVLERLEDVRIALEQAQVDRLDEPAADEPQARVTRRRHDVELLRVRREQGVRLVRRAEDLWVDLAARLGLELGHPVDRLVGRAVLDVTRPGQHVDRLALRAPRPRPARSGLRSGPCSAPSRRRHWSARPTQPSMAPPSFPRSNRRRR